MFLYGTCDGLVTLGSLEGILEVKLDSRDGLRDELGELPVESVSKMELEIRIRKIL